MTSRLKESCKKSVKNGLVGVKNEKNPFEESLLTSIDA
jgi:hypothetical protein